MDDAGEADPRAASIPERLQAPAQLGHPRHGARKGCQGGVGQALEADDEHLAPAGHAVGGDGAWQPAAPGDQAETAHGINPSGCTAAGWPRHG